LIDLLEPFSRLATAGGRRLLWSCPAGVVVQADRSILKQIMFNLLSNALKHGDQDILLRVRSGRLGVSLLLGNRLPERTQASGHGLGIGLRLVQALANQMEQTRLAIRRQRFFWVRLQLPAGEAIAIPSQRREQSRKATSQLNCDS
jgi:C4-dicarboxylate-specific signal transduction histidine kinase